MWLTKIVIGATLSLRIQESLLENFPTAMRQNYWHEKQIYICTIYYHLERMSSIRAVIYNEGVFVLLQKTPAKVNLPWVLLSILINLGLWDFRAYSLPQLTSEILLGLKYSFTFEHFFTIHNYRLDNISSSFLSIISDFS